MKTKEKQNAIYDFVINAMTEKGWVCNGAGNSIFLINEGHKIEIIFNRGNIYCVEIEGIEVYNQLSFWQKRSFVKNAIRLYHYTKTDVIWDKLRDKGIKL